MLRSAEILRLRAAGAERCGYGDLQLAASAVDVWGLNAASGEQRRSVGHGVKTMVSQMAGPLMRLGGDVRRG